MRCGAPLNRWVVARTIWMQYAGCTTPKGPAVCAVIAMILRANLQGSEELLKIRGIAYTARR